MFNRPASGRRGSTPASSAEWIAYFRANGRKLRPIPWHEDPDLSDQHRAAIGFSIAEFQLGESSEGRHLMGYAREHAARSGDTDYVEAMGLFIAEENRHAHDLGRFMDLAQIPRKGRTFSDSCFRRLRRLATLEMAIVVLVTAEIIAQVYYRALRCATPSPILRAVCGQILADERAHVRFQCERLALLREGCSAGALWWRGGVHRLIMLLAIGAVWINHASALRIGGYDPGRFWRHVWIKGKRAFQIADPRRYRSRPVAPYLRRPTVTQGN